MWGSPLSVSVPLSASSSSCLCGLANLAQHCRPPPHQPLDSLRHHRAHSRIASNVDYTSSLRWNQNRDCSMVSGLQTTCLCTALLFFTFISTIHSLMMHRDTYPICVDMYLANSACCIFDFYMMSLTNSVCTLYVWYINFSLISEIFISVSMSVIVAPVVFVFVSWLWLPVCLRLWWRDSVILWIYFCTLFDDFVLVWLVLSVNTQLSTPSIFPSIHWSSLFKKILKTVSLAVIWMQFCLMKQTRLVSKRYTGIYSPWAQRRVNT